MSEFLSQVHGFTPVIDVLAQEVGLVTAVVYGIVWRYCQMDDRVCRASINTIARHVHLSRRTVERHLSTLCEHGYLVDTTPDLEGRPHVYADAGRVKIVGLVEARMELEPATESRTPSENLRQKVAGGATESRRGCDRKSQGGATESRTKKEVHDTSHESREEHTAAPAALAEISQLWFKTWGRDIPPTIVQEIEYWERECEAVIDFLPEMAPGADLTGLDWIHAAVQEAARCKDTPPPAKYLDAILCRWQQDGFRAGIPETEEGPPRGRNGPADGDLPPGVTREVMERKLASLDMSRRRE